MLDVLKKITKYGDIALACGIVGILMVLLFPVPTSLLDFLLAFSIATAVVIMMTTLFIGKPLELSVFPTILLVTTLLRLSLNIASTRLILANGHLGTDAAGHRPRQMGLQQRAWLCQGGQTTEVTPICRSGLPAPPWITRCPMPRWAEHRGDICGPQTCGT